MAVGKAQPVGKAVIVYGTVKAVSADGLERVLTPNSVIYADDRIVTGSDGSISITFTGSPNAMMLGRMSDVLIDEEVYGGTAADGSGDFSASVADIQQALEQDPDLDPGEVLPPPAAGAGVAGAGGGGRQIVVFDATQMEVTPDSGAETRGIGWDFLDPPYWVYPGVDDGAEAPFEPPIDGEVVVPVPPPVPPPGPAPTVSMDSITVNEGEPAVFEIHLTGVGEGSTLALTLADGSAVSPDEYASGGLEYSLDGGTTWSEYTGPVSVPAGESVVLVRTD
ncbi:MAG: retention module-containing protein, partial [Desulfobulbus sp.]|nr:retention module-containing protein [Desulfobulbus sp.]